MQNVFDLHRRATDLLVRELAPLRPADLDRPTPCAGWDLRALLEHMVGQDLGFAAAVRAALADRAVDAAAFAPRPLGPAPAAIHAAGAVDLVAAFAEAATLARPVHMPEFGADFPVSMVAAFHLVDTVVHGWDVTAALGRQDAFAAALDADVVAGALDVAEQVPDDSGRDAPGAAFARAHRVDPDADPLPRTLALLGRDPAWAPGAPVR